MISFANEILLFWKADPTTAQILKAGINAFSELSGMHVNPSKSHVILSKSVEGVRDVLPNLLGFVKGRLPVKFLGVPLIASKLSVADCKLLFDKIENRISGWSTL